MDAIKELFNLVADPRLFFLLSVAALVLIVWKREAFAKLSVGYGLMGFLTAFFLFGLTDENFVLIIAKPDNVPIVALIFLVVFFTLVLDAPGRAQRSAGRGRGRRHREGGVGPGLGVAGPRLYRAHLARPVQRHPGGLVDRPGGADRAAGESRQYSQPVEGRPGISWASRRCSSTSIPGSRASCCRA